MIKIGLIGTQSMHAWSFAEALNVPMENGSFRCENARVVAAYGVDDDEEHIKFTLEKGNIPKSVDSFEEMLTECNAFMILQRKGGEHIKYAEEIIKRGYPVFIDKPVCDSLEGIEKLKNLAKENNTVICGGSGLKHIDDILELKKLIETGYFEEIRGATINHSADINSPYDGILFYLPHGVEMMLELFGYNPVSVNTTVLSNNNFTVCVKYSDKLVNLAISSCRPSFITINGTKSITKEIDSANIFKDEIKHFVSEIEKNNITKDVSKLTKHVEVILKIKESIEKKQEIIL